VLSIIYRFLTGDLAIELVRHLDEVELCMCVAGFAGDMLRFTSDYSMIQYDNAPTV